MKPTLDEIIQGAVDTLEALEVGDVDSRTNGASTWSKAPSPKRTYWIVSHEQSEGRNAGVGGTWPGKGLRRRTRTVVIDVWMPWSPRLATAELHRDRLNIAINWLIKNRGLGVCARMIGLPHIARNTVEPYSSPNQGDLPTTCHHGTIKFEVVSHRAVAGR